MFQAFSSDNTNYTQFNFKSLWPMDNQQDATSPMPSKTSLTIQTNHFQQSKMNIQKALFQTSRNNNSSFESPQPQKQVKISQNLFQNEYKMLSPRQKYLNNSFQIETEEMEHSEQNANSQKIKFDFHFNHFKSKEDCNNSVDRSQMEENDINGTFSEFNIRFNLQKNQSLVIENDINNDLFDSPIYERRNSDVNIQNSSPITPLNIQLSEKQLQSPPRNKFVKKDNPEIKYRHLLFQKTSSNKQNTLATIYDNEQDYNKQEMVSPFKIFRTVQDDKMEIQDFNKEQPSPFKIRIAQDDKMEIDENGEQQEPKVKRKLNFIQKMQLQNTPYKSSPQNKIIINENLYTPQKKNVYNEHENTPIRIKKKENCKQQFKKIRDLNILSVLSKQNKINVYLCQSNLNKQKYILKEIPLHDEIISDLRILSKWGQGDSKETQHVVKFYESWIEDNKLYVVIELCKYSVEKLLQERPSENTIRKLIIEISNSLNFLHQQKCYHLAIKPTNILLSQNDSFKIADLGISTMFYQQESDQQYLNKKYFAPEFDCRKDQVIDYQKCDIYSFGIILYDLLEGNVFTGTKSNIKKITNNQKYSNSLKYLIMRMIDINPKFRPTAQEILDKIFYGIDDDYLVIQSRYVKEKNQQLQKQIDEIEIKLQKTNFKIQRKKSFEF